MFFPHVNFSLALTTVFPSRQLSLFPHVNFSLTSTVASPSRQNFPHTFPLCLCANCIWLALHPTQLSPQHSAPHAVCSPRCHSLRNWQRNELGAVIARQPRGKPRAAGGAAARAAARDSCQGKGGGRCPPRPAARAKKYSAVLKRCQLSWAALRHRNSCDAIRLAGRSTRPRRQSMRILVHFQHICCQIQPVRSPGFPELLRTKTMTGSTP